MFFRVKDVYNRARLRSTLQHALRAPPISLESNAPFALMSQIREKDVLMYILAVKSFCRWHQPRRVTVLVDGVFSDKSIRTLNAHIPGIVIEPHVKYRSSQCPNGGTWERLLALVKHAAEIFTIQLDADTITLGRLCEVEECITKGRAFTLGSLQGRKIEAGALAARRARESIASGDTHIQTGSESILDRFIVPGREIRYVRGCSGFTGIPEQAVPTDLVESWAQSLGQLVGPRWTEWGTEQFMSNLVIANIDGSVVLSHPEYATCPNIDEERTLLAHLAGFCRFANNNQYARFARVAIGRL